LQFGAYSTDPAGAASTSDCSDFEQSAIGAAVTTAVGVLVGAVVGVLVGAVVGVLDGAVVGVFVGAVTVVAVLIAARANEKFAAALFQLKSVPQPGENTPMVIVYEPSAAPAGTCQLEEYLMLCPAVNAWLSQACWKTLADEALCTSTSTSTLEALLLVTDELIEIVWPGASVLGDNVAPLLKVDAGAGAVVDDVDAVAV
jgi:hypothetical protein